MVWYEGGKIMEIFAKEKTYDFMKFTKIFFTFSMVCVVLSLGLLFTKGLNYGIDFSGGTLVQIKYQQKAPLDKIRESLEKNDVFKDAVVTEFGSPDEVIIRFSGSTDDLGQDLSKTVSNLLQGSGDFEIRRVDIVGPKAGNELKAKGLMALAISLIGILIYISFRFEWRFAVASVAALVHDVVVTLGVLIIAKIDINLDTLAAILTVIGYSLNDNIIIFDRIRENIEELKSNDLNYVINTSVSLTLSRTILTSLTTFFVIFTLYFFGGEILNGFSFTLLIGIIVGTYSSVFVAAVFLRWLGFDLQTYKAKLAEKEKKRVEKEKIRAKYEQGIV